MHTRSWWLIDDFVDFAEREEIDLTLRDLKPGQQGKVIGVTATGAMKRRIMDMGVTPGVEIKVIKTAPLGDPVEVHVRGYELSMRKDEAAQIQVEA